MKNAGGEQALCISLHSSMCLHAGGLTVKCHINTRQAPDVEQPKAKGGGG